MFCSTSFSWIQPASFSQVVYLSVTRPAVDSGRFRGQRTLFDILSPGKAPQGTDIMICPLEGHIRGPLNSFCPLSYPLERQPSGPYTGFCPLGRPPFMLFVHRKETLEVLLSCLFCCKQTHCKGTQRAFYHILSTGRGTLEATLFQLVCWKGTEVLFSLRPPAALTARQQNGSICFSLRGGTKRDRPNDHH